MFGFFSLGISSVWVNRRIRTENQHSKLPGSCLKVWVVGGLWLESELSDRLWLQRSLGRVKQKSWSQYRDLILEIKKYQSQLKLLYAKSQSHSVIFHLAQWFAPMVTCQQLLV